MRRRAVLILLVVLSLGMGACSSGDSSGDPPGGTDTAPGPGVSAPPVMPLTGMPITDPAKAARPALVVKIDNADGAGKANQARPQSGLNAADVVYEEMVEGSVTRFAAVFQSTDADPVGPIRSARLTDIDIVTPFNRPLFAWSGGNPTVAGAIRGANLVDLSFDAAANIFTRRKDKVAPHNLYSSTPELYAARPEDTSTPPQLFGYRPDGEAVPGTARPAGTVHLEFRNGPASAPVDWSWDAGQGAFVRSQKGSPHLDEGGQQINPANVIVQLTPYFLNGDGDVLGTPVSQANLVGSGKCHALTAGVIIDCTWAKASPEAVTLYTDASGAPLRLTPGRTWVELVPDDGVYAER